MTTLDLDETHEGRPLTGKTVLVWLGCFFGAMLIANAFFVYYALSTFSGLDNPSSYKAGRNYGAQIEAAEAQAIRDWSVNVDIVRSGDGVNIDLIAKDHSAAPVRGVTFELHLGHPADRRHDVTVPLTVADLGHFRGRVEAVSGGWWTLTVAGTRDGEPVYKSVERIRLP
jgi:nitrogen fixation protein FixH